MVKSKIFPHLNSSQSIPLIFIVTFSIILYATTLNNGFVYDDEFTIVKNTFIKDIKNLPKLFGKDYSNLSTEVSYRPIVTFTYFIDYAIFGLRPWGYHLTNVLLHAINCALFYIFLALIIKPSITDGRSLPLSKPLIIALLFVSHPALTEAVNAISFREDLLVFLFYITALNLYIYLKSRPKGYTTNIIYLSSLILYFFALLSKEIAATLPLMICCYEWVNREKNENLGSIILNRYTLGYLLITVAYLYLRFSYFYNPVEEDISKWKVMVRFLTVPWLFANYLKMSLFPISLSADYVVSPVESFYSLSFVIPTITLITIFLTIKLNRVEYRKEMMLGVILFFITLLPVINIIPIANPFADRYLYLPVAGFAMVTGLLICTAFKSQAIARNYLVLIPFLAILCINSFLTGQRNMVWETHYSLWSDTVNKSPNSNRPRNNLGIASLRQNRFDEAIYHFKIALKLDPNNFDVRNNLGLAYLNKRQYAEAAEEFKAVLQQRPESVEARNGLGFVYYKQGKIDNAIREYNAALKIKPDAVEVYINIARVEYDRGQFGNAIGKLKEALRDNPFHAGIHNGLGEVYFKKGLFEEALSEYYTALRLDPDSATAYYGIGQVHRSRGEIKEAQNSYVSALKINPIFPEAHNDLGIVYAGSGMLRESVEEFLKAIQQNPDYADAHYNLGLAYSFMNLKDEARKEFETALKLKPDFKATMEAIEQLNDKP